MRSDREAPLRWTKVLVWLALVAGLLLIGDLTERFLRYDIVTRDRGSPLRLARRPLKDTALRGLHALPHEIENPLDLPVFDFYLKPADEQLLRAQMRRVQELGTHDDFTREEVSARMEVEGQGYDVRVKLRGRQYYHVIAPRPSLRVQLRHGRAYRGSTVFNLIDPFDKTGDQVFLWESLEHGLIGWDTTMGVLAVRGEPLAVVQYVEQPRIAMGDHAGRPEGMFFRPGKGRGLQGKGEQGEIYSEGNDPERCGKVVERVWRWAADTEGTLGWEELQELFDVERLRWFTALTEFSGDGHGFADFNMKGFCDPVSLKAEFLIWDTRFGNWSGLERSQFPDTGAQFLRCDRFRVLHDQALYTLATERLEPMLARGREFFEQYGELLEEDPMFRFPRGGPDGGFMGDRPEKLERTLRKNAGDIRAALEGTQLAWYVDREAGTLELATSERGGKLVTALILAEGDGSSALELAEPLTVYGRYRERAPVIVWPLSGSIRPETILGVRGRNACTGAAVEGQRSETPLEGQRLAWEPEPGLPELPPLPAGCAVDPARGEITIGPGAVRPAGSLSFPRGWEVVFEPGTELLLAPAATVEIRGRLRMIGRADLPIVVRPAADEPWGAFAVLGERTAPVGVEVAHTTFSGGSGSNAGSVRCTGSVAFYFTDLRLDHVTVEKNTSEDAINPKFSTVQVTDCLYRDGASDAVDYDFCTGTDLRTRVERFGNDGIDISGSRMRLEGAVIREVGDKALSIGEGSRPEYRDITVIGARTGCAVKDKSAARIEALTISRAGTAIALYCKKESFGPSQAVFRDLLVLDSDAMLLLDQGCQLRFEGAVRLGAEEDGMRPFEGVSNEFESGLSALSLDALAERGASWRRERAGGAPGDARPTEASYGAR